MHVHVQVQNIKYYRDYIVTVRVVCVSQPPSTEEVYTRISEKPLYQISMRQSNRL